MFSLSFNDVFPIFEKGRWEDFDVVLCFIVDDFVRIVRRMIFFVFCHEI